MAILLTIFVTLQMIIVINLCSATTFIIVNKCTYTVWPGILSNAGVTQLSPTGFTLPSSATFTITAPSSWAGRLWARTHCTTNSTTGVFSCLTGDCSTGTIECSGSGAIPPATLAEFTLSGYNGLDFYDVSLVDGYNLPLAIVPQGGAGNCSATGCYVDLNGSCPVELRMSVNGSSGGSVACRSACEAFGEAEYCCSGAYSTPSACKPSGYSEYFKSDCPTAYSYAYDDTSSTFTCAGADYVLTFCPTPVAIEKSSEGETAVSPAKAPAISSTATVTEYKSIGTIVLFLCSYIFEYIVIV